MKITITGGAGYVGSILSRELLKENEVTVLDNLHYGIDPIKGLLRNKKFTLIEGDIRDMSNIIKAVNYSDVVIHLAAIVGKPSAELDSKTTMEINYLSTKNLVELCNLYEVKKIIFASSCSVYGNQPNSQLQEDLPPNPIEIYAETKLKSENALQNLANMPVIILRLGTLFGLSYRMRFDLAINLFIAKALNGKKLTVFGGEQHRPFLHVRDAAEAFKLAVDGGYSGIYNVISKNYKIIDIAKLISKKLNGKIEVSEEITDERDYFVKGEKFKKIFNFKPKYNLNHAIKEISDSGLYLEYKSDKYSNFKLILNSKKLQRKVYTLGGIFEK